MPYLVALLSDPAALVRARSLRALTAVTARVRSLPVGEANLFPEYIFPAIERLPIDPEEVVRLAHAQCIARLAQNSKRFLEMAQFQLHRTLRAQQLQQQHEQLQQQQQPANAAGASSAGGLRSSASLVGLSSIASAHSSTSLSSAASSASASAAFPDSFSSSSSASAHSLTAAMRYPNSYDAELARLQDTVQRIVVDLLVPSAASGAASVKRALLADLGTRLPSLCSSLLCVFASSSDQSANDWLFCSSTRDNFVSCFEENVK